MVLLRGLQGQVHGARRLDFRALPYSLAQVAAGLPLLTSSKKGCSSHQLHRTLGITYKSAWFLAHRIRECMAETDPPTLGGEGKVIEADETYYGRAGDPKDYIFVTGKGWIRQGGDEKMKVMTLVERGGAARSVHLDKVTSREVHSVLVRHAAQESELHTDEAKVYKRVGKRFAKHETVNHSIEEYARGKVTTNTVEGYFSIFKRGMIGIYQHCNERHLHRYLAEFDFRYSNRKALGIEDPERAERGSVAPPASALPIGGL